MPYLQPPTEDLRNRTVDPDDPARCPEMSPGGVRCALHVSHTINHESPDIDEICGMAGPGGLLCQLPLWHKSPHALTAQGFGGRHG